MLLKFIHNTVIMGICPDVVVHLAAMSSPVGCHKDKEMAYSVNAPEALAESLHNLTKDALLIFASTDMVYEGNNPPYDELVNEAKPCNNYGASKLKVSFPLEQILYFISIVFHVNVNVYLV